MNYSYTLALVATGICSYICYFVWQTQKFRALSHAHGCKLPPQYPHIDPIFGLDLFIRNAKAISQNRFLPDLQERYKKLGWTFGSLSFGSGAIASVEPENLRTIWVTKFEDWGVQPLRLPALAPFFPPSKYRKLEAVRRLFSAVSGTAAKRWLYRGSTNILYKAPTLFLFGESLGSLSGNKPPHSEGFLEAFQEGFSGTGMRIALGPLNFLLSKKKWLRACATSHRFADHYVQKALKYREQFLAGKTDWGNSKASILLYNMAEQTGDPIYLRNQILQALMAAQETTANLLGNIFFLISRHPAVFQKLRAQVLSTAGDLDYNKLMGMKYLQNVINEALRLYPVLPQLNRHALRDTILPVGGGPDGRSPIFVPFGTKFDTSFYVLHHLPNIWGPDVEEFRPERWDTMKPNAWEYVPFAGGPRVCAGQQKATIEASYVVARMLQEFEKVESRDDRPWWLPRVRLRMEPYIEDLPGLHVIFSTNHNLQGGIRESIRRILQNFREGKRIDHTYS
ncbi:hypothetical protein G7Y89_g3274 [Cudoniella acicularis]|uniref:Cytochrome P450 n=1 Tax=Cudoniella acicularis TaxID=354080 RepID=A0A8H4RTM8_9HELO|nr:hypothetical protein G7Y89_g3274 [Cudoniella acicularis]